MCRRGRSLTKRRSSPCAEHDIVRARHVEGEATHGRKRTRGEQWRLALLVPMTPRLARVAVVSVTTPAFPLSLVVLTEVCHFRARR